MDHIVPAGEHPATRRDLGVHADRVDDRLSAFDRRMDERFARMDDRMTAFEQRMDDRMTAFEQRMDEKLATLRADLTAVFREELVSAVSGQTRALIIANATTVLGIGALAVTLAQLG